ncbi:MAG: pyrroline-5-carboxylate reductase, partial [Alphaproteobacteria bacterium]|nr:pyrroline-5-carboxylate reductase [Alphaproteobacteria bacterium]
MRRAGVARDPILLVGAGRMGLALLKGWIARRIRPVIVIEPKPSPELKKIARHHRVPLFADRKAVAGMPLTACIVALKPQVLKTEAAAFRSIAESGALMISIAAGTGTKAMGTTWGKKARVVRAMPNLPGAIGRGMTALYAGKGVTSKDRTLAESLVAALGDTAWVKSERDIDVVTAVSGSGPAYVFLLAEALEAAARAEGLSPALAARLARATVAGSGALLDADPTPAATLRDNVTSKGGTTAAALAVLMARKDGLSPLM